MATLAFRKTAILAALAAYPTWLAFLALQEVGHVLHAWLSGGVVRELTVPLWGFSFTDVGPNPRPAFVAWGGALWGSLIPLMLFAIVRAAAPRAVRAALGFAGFCLIGNGAYLGCGGFIAAGDAADLVRLGCPHWVLILSGVSAIACGLWLWHIASKKPEIGPAPVKALHQ